MDWAVAAAATCCRRALLSGHALPSAHHAPQGDNTALHWAAMRGHVEIVKYLLQQVRAAVLGSGGDSRRRTRGGRVQQGALAASCSCTAPRVLMPPSPPADGSLQGANRNLRNKQEKLAVDQCQPCWSNSWRFCKEVLAEY